MRRRCPPAGRCLAAVIGLCLSGLAAAETLPRVMSTNLCADVLLLSLADPAQIVSVSYKSQDPRQSSMAERAAAYPGNRATAEEVIALAPDILLTSRRWLSRQDATLFARHGIRVVRVPFPRTWAEIFATTRQVGAQIGRADAAQALVDTARQRLAGLHRDAQPVSALYLRPNGGSAGRGTHVDAVLEAAGFRNHATALGLDGWGTLSLEALVNDPPAVIVVSNLQRDATYARNGFARHPQIRRLLAERPVLQMTQNDWGCSNLQLAQAAEALATQWQLAGAPAGHRP
ncbi:ABC transporter substrate-binding protein [Denitromonas iodatirespirans]|uniref:ABC transporter substrate-binding protein n=1 Tax=Denitromonas iodatirespirans TaxID=2795389 RepID=A0A944DQ40_DENI1|nr:ABC transporter substrate-binding protein [Denitromonas iodatirespirans]MBT0962569.1 ABC transporter substrate-binding protein [Denitromonas iodatirespirans]